MPIGQRQIAQPQWKRFVLSFSIAIIKRGERRRKRETKIVNEVDHQVVRSARLDVFASRDKYLNQRFRSNRFFKVSRIDVLK